MEESPDPIKTNAAESGMSQELIARLQDEFEAVTQICLAGLEADNRQMMERSKMTEAENTANIESNRRRFAGMSLERRASFVISNFFMWLPGGMNRNYFEERKAANRASDAQQIEAEERLVKDLDSALVELGINGEQIDSMLKGGGDIESDHEKLLEAYFKMRDKGYDWMTLVR